jgi:alkylation response protein AidB-like acyl-CoA dehydrogenase
MVELRGQVRSFLAEELDRFPGRPDIINGFDAAFSREVGRRGWIGASWPETLGGRGWSAESRFVILEEMLAAGAPVLAHMVGERQFGPLLLRYGTDEQRRRFLPRIASGEAFFCIGMSEAAAGSDLSALETRASPVTGGYRLSGAKLWTSLAHLADYAVVLCRTSEHANPREGLTQLVVNLRSSGVVVAPIHNIVGEHEFNQVFFDDVLVPEGDVVGTVGEGWRQALSELTSERGGPDRYLSNFPLLARITEQLRLDPDPRASETIGRLVAHLSALRSLTEDVAVALAAGREPSLEAAIVKASGAAFEQDLLESLRPLMPPGEDRRALLAEATLRGPSYSIRGGTREVLLSLIGDRVLRA